VLTMAFAHLGDAENAWDLFGIINPVRHADTPERMATWKSEPYVMAADVYGCAPHTGRGRVDVVHRRGRMDVPPDQRIPARVAA